MHKSLVPISLLLLAACGGVRSYTRPTVGPLPDAYACAVRRLQEMGYTLTLQDSVGGLVQGRREITGIVEAARRGAAKATEVVTVGLAGGSRKRYDELTVFVYFRQYPQGNTVESTAGLLTLSGQTEERGAPTDDAKRDAKRLLGACALRH
jgi:hypothetical protein